MNFKEHPQNEVNQKELPQLKKDFAKNKAEVKAEII